MQFLFEGRLFRVYEGSKSYVKCWTRVLFSSIPKRYNCYVPVIGPPQGEELGWSQSVRILFRSL